MTAPAASAITQAEADHLSKMVAEAPPRTVRAALRLLDAAADRHELDRFFAQALNALVRVANADDAASLARAESDDDALFRAIERPEFLAELQPRDPLAPARLRGLALKRRLLAAEGGVVSAQTLADALGISRQAIDKRRKNGRLIALSLGRRGYAYPIWQAGLDGLPEVLAVLGDLDPWTQAAYMLAPNRWLDGNSPLAALRAGNRQGVLAAARLYGEQVAA